MTDTTPIVDGKHTDQSIPYEWTAYETRDETIVTHSTDSPTANSYRVAGVATNPDAIAEADAVLFEGTLLEPVEDDGLYIDLCHFHAGRMHSIGPEETIDEPVVLLERLERVDGTLAEYEAASVDYSHREYLAELKPPLVLASVIVILNYALETFVSSRVGSAFQVLLLILYIPLVLVIASGLFLALKSFIRNGVYRR